MPYFWKHLEPEQGEDARAELDLWPHRSLPPQGFVWVIGLTAGALALPMLAVLGTKILWGLLPFAILAVAALWIGIRQSYKSGDAHEHLVLTHDQLCVMRHDPGKPNRFWRTNPYWARVNLRHNGPVEDYLTMTDGKREIELGAFLSPEERQALYHDLQAELARIR